MSLITTETRKRGHLLSIRRRDEAWELNYLGKDLKSPLETAMLGKHEVDESTARQG